MDIIRKVEVNGHELEVRSWFVQGWEKDGVIFKGKGSHEVVKVDGEMALDFFLKNPTEYFDLCKLVQS